MEGKIHTIDDNYFDDRGLIEDLRISDPSSYPSAENIRLQMEMDKSAKAEPGSEM